MMAEPFDTVFFDTDTILILPRSENSILILSRTWNFDTDTILILSRTWNFDTDTILILL